MEVEKLKVEVSAHHCHLTQETLDVLFGTGFYLDSHFLRPLSQHGQYVSDVRVAIETLGKDGKVHRMNRISILGPARKYNQFECSLTDGRTLGVDLPIRVSGDVEGSVPLTVMSLDEKGNVLKKVSLPFGLVAPKRHIHCNPEQAKKLGVVNGQIVKVDVTSDSPRHVIFDDVVIRINPSFDLAMHLDTDEGNAAGIKKFGTGFIVG